MTTSEAAVYTISHVTAAPGKDTDVQDWLRKVAAASRVQSGCVSWTAYVNVHKLTQYAVVAQFANEAAYHERSKAEWWTDLVSQLPDMTTGEIHHEVYRVII